MTSGTLEIYRGKRRSREKDAKKLDIVALRNICIESDYLMPDWNCGHAW